MCTCVCTCVCECMCEGGVCVYACICFALHVSVPTAYCSSLSLPSSSLPLPPPIPAFASLRPMWSMRPTSAITLTWTALGTLTTSRCVHVPSFTCPPCCHAPEHDHGCRFFSRFMKGHGHALLYVPSFLSCPRTRSRVQHKWHSCDAASSVCCPCVNPAECMDIKQVFFISAAPVTTWRRRINLD